MQYFSKKYIDFFKELNVNNNREWFGAHRKDYECDVKKPFQKLIDDILSEIQRLDPDIAMQPKDAIFRINRDIRFSKDKTPYNTMMKAGFAKGGRKSPYAGYYLGIDAENIHVGGGMYMIDKDNLVATRKHIAENTSDFKKLIEEKSFNRTFGNIQGEKAKRLDKNFQNVLSEIPLIANKQFYYMAVYPTSKYLESSDLLMFLMSRFEIITPLNAFFKEAVDSY